ncbi:unnamed protein product [Dicrocoelium dendriticum]|nr:unnamed protein product [Dicrocoelium dendriticum]
MSVVDEDEFQCKEEDEVSIPRAALNKFIKDVLPDARLTTETRELLLACTHAFIHQLTTQANVACTATKKKTISPEHIFQGLDSMNLSTYKERAMEACEEAKEELKGRRMLSASYRFKHQDSEELERLMREQQKLFQQARADFAEEQLNRNDLLAASELAAADVAFPNNCAAPTSPAVTYKASSNIISSTETVQDIPSTQNLTGTARIFGAYNIGDDDNYDD